MIVRTRGDLARYFLLASATGGVGVVLLVGSIPILRGVGEKGGEGWGGMREGGSAGYERQQEINGMGGGGEVGRGEWVNDEVRVSVLLL